MDSKFIYVFTETDKDTMLANGFKLLTEDKAKNVYVFVNRDDLTFRKDQVGLHVMTDLLSFI